LSLSKNSTLAELFAFTRNPENDVQVMPVTLSENNDPHAELMIIIQGKSDTAHTIMAGLMQQISDMHDIAEQHEAEKKAKAPDMRVVNKDGTVLDDEPRIILS
jgi:hypothetical protein